MTCFSCSLPFKTLHTHSLSNFLSFCAMSRSAAVELDFFAMAEEKFISRTSSFAREQTVRTNPPLLRSVFATAGWPTGPAPLPTMKPNPKMVSESPPSRSAPLTIFYNGTVTVFDVNHVDAEKIIKVAEEGSGSDKEKLPLNPRREMPMARKQSLQRFLEKRKERLTATAPYSSGTEGGFLKEKAAMGWLQFVAASPHNF